MYLSVDIETTSVKVEAARIVQLGIVVLPDADEGTAEYSLYVDPQIEIPHEASDVHHITKEVLIEKNAKPFKEYADWLLSIFQTADGFVGYNLMDYDLPVLRFEFGRCNLVFDFESKDIVDGFIIYNRKERRTLEAAHEYFCPDRIEVGDAHDALVDSKMAARVAIAQLDKYDFKTFKEMSDFCKLPPDGFYDRKCLLKWDGEVLKFNFGKCNGMSLKQAALESPDYLAWMLKQDFSTEVKEAVRLSFAGKTPERRV